MNILEYGTGSPLVLLHGWGFDSQIWSPIIPLLSSKYHLYCVDLPGFGETPWMEWLSFQAILLDKLPATFALAGWSLGGLYATRLAVENTDRVTHLINIASSPRFTQDTNWAGIETGILENFHSNLLENPARTLQQFQALQQHNLSTPQGQNPSPQGLQSGLTILRDWDLRTALIPLKKPVCYMFGRLDAIVPANTLTCMQTKYPDFHYILFRKSAHIPFLSESSLFIDALQDFIL